MIEHKNGTHTKQALETVLSLVPDGVIGVKLQVLPGSAQDNIEEAYALVCAGNNCIDKVTIQILPAEYMAIKQFFPPCSPGSSSTVSLAKISEALRRLLVMELLANVN